MIHHNICNSSRLKKFQFIAFLSIKLIYFKVFWKHDKRNVKAKWHEERDEEKKKEKKKGNNSMFMFFLKLIIDKICLYLTLELFIQKCCKNADIWKIR